MRTRLIAGSLFVLLAVSASWAGDPLGNAFTYQGRLNDGGSPANGLYDLRFTLFNAATGGAQIGTTVCLDNVSVSDGIFTVPLDFGEQFTGQRRFIQIEVRRDTGLGCSDATGYSVLTPRQECTAAPYSLYSKDADRLGGFASSEYLRFISAPLTLTATVPGDAAIRGTNDSGVAGSTGVLGSASFIEGATIGVRGQSASAAGVGVLGDATSTSLSITSGVVGRSASPLGRGIFGEATAASGDTFGVHGRSASTVGTGVFGEADAVSGITFGVFGSSDSTGGRGVQGVAGADTGLTYGGRFESASTQGIGVEGVASAATGITSGVHGVSASFDGRGVFGEATHASGNTIGVFGRSLSPVGSGVAGRAVATSGLTNGVYGESNSPDGRGVEGQATSSTGITRGVRGVSLSTSGIGVGALAAATSGFTFGVNATSNSTTGIGVKGLATAGTGSTFGVLGESASSSGTGVRGVASGGGPQGVLGETTNPNGFGVFAVGRLGSTGPKPFRIDHPDDPANKHLLHYATESPEVINFYRGTVTLDGAGQAVVELPRYFGKINRTPSYQLTAVGAPMPMLHIAEKISAAALRDGAKAEPGEAAPLCSFCIAGGVPGGEVSWRVEALRNDRWVQQRGAPVEVEKQGLEKGTYQHPELYGMPPEKGMNYDAQRDRQSRAAPLEAGDKPTPD